MPRGSRAPPRMDPISRCPQPSLVTANEAKQSRSVSARAGRLGLLRSARNDRRPDMIAPFIDSSDLLPNGPALAQRMRRDGYLFLPNLLPREAIANVQRQIAGIAHDAGWLRRDTPPEDAIADPSGFCVDPDPTYLQTLRQINRLEDYHA